MMGDRAIVWLWGGYGAIVWLWGNATLLPCPRRAPHAALGGAHGVERGQRCAVIRCHPPHPLRDPGLSNGTGRDAAHRHRSSAGPGSSAALCGGLPLKPPGRAEVRPGPPEVCRERPKCAGTTRTVPGPPEVLPGPPEVCRDRPKCRRNDPKCRRDRPKCRRDLPKCAGTTRSAAGTTRSVAGIARSVPGSPEVPPEPAEVPPDARGDPRRCHVGRAGLGAGAAGAARRCG